MCAQLVTERTVPGVKLLREAHPKTPILLVEDRNIQTGFLVEARRKGERMAAQALPSLFLLPFRDHRFRLPKRSRSILQGPPPAAARYRNTKQ